MSKVVLTVAELASKNLCWGFLRRLTMARCPFAVWHPMSGSCGRYLGGPFKIVHHTTEGNSAKGAMDAFASNHSDPHFTVDATTIYQHVDTMEGARALRNTPGGVETNRDSAVQIELVGYAHLPKNPQALTNVARLCRWIEATHGVPRVWPSGPPKPAVNGKDPGGHNRNPAIWDNQGGHYGHCHVPENTHWDPAYTADEANFVLQATFDATGKLESAPLAPPPSPVTRARRAFTTEAIASSMPDHADVLQGIKDYIRDLPLESREPATLTMAERAAIGPSTTEMPLAAPLPPGPAAATVDAGSVLSFVEGMDAQETDDVLCSVLLAQRGASGAYNRFTETADWYGKYVEILESIGWTTEQMGFTRYAQTEGEFRMDKAALAIVMAIATQSQLTVLKEAVVALGKLADDDASIQLFDFHSSHGVSGNFQLGAVQKSGSGAISMALGAFYFASTDERRHFLFFKWGTQNVQFWTAAQRMTLNTTFYGTLRNDVIARLADRTAYIGNLHIA